MSVRAFNPLRWRRLAVAAVLLAAALAGCGDKETRPTAFDPPAFLPRTSPANLLHNLLKAYETRNLAEYESLLAKDFTFVLSEEDQQKPGVPDSWGRAPEIQIHTNLFDASLVRTLTLAFEPADSVRDPADGTYTALIGNVHIYLVGARPAHPTDVMEFMMTNGWSRFWFRKNGWSPPGTQDSIWTIVKWEDEPLSGARAARGSGSGVQPLTWGTLKVAFRSEAR
jgi:hypothetical protein